MLSLTANDEIKIIEGVHRSTLQQETLPAALSHAEQKLECKLFVIEFDRFEHHTGRYCCPEKAAQLIDFLTGIKAEGNTSALTFLLRTASANYPYCKAKLLSQWPEGAGMLDRVCQHSNPNDIANWPGFITPLIRDNSRCVLFGCLFPNIAISDADPAAVAPVFSRLSKALLVALNVHDKIAQFPPQQDMLGFLFQSPGQLSFILDRDFRLVQPSMRDVPLETIGHLFDCRADRIVPRVRDIEAALIAVSDELANAARQNKSGACRPTEPHSIFVENDHRALSHVVVRGVSRKPTTVGPSQDHILIVVRDQRPPSKQVVSLLNSRFGLSSREAELAYHLSITGSMQDTLTRLEITRNTAKTHLRRIFEKTNCQSQLALSRLVHELGQLF
ncbi:DNA-binding CsgD family transcriptional regulator [Roseibium hamelinense]|uniref:DNA-binding CsgD family transcriptional regulator n=1 Tax=Roseibium hamelinense TaxID=150831 RepID=A0A562STL7_9HYPH|nr:helix-turn-helix transcriptional regulator [Roseibium hamelinense]MTI42702.1 helix-turn-helix transcriptional regulator [Roseibium hamelinense]TWI84581.1 DNA-binding CsgD family transcriptional regulator [Roseibium hamelinense]